MVEKALHELLKGFAGGRVHPMRADENTAAPFVIFQRTDRNQWRDINGPAGMAQAYMQVDCYANGYYDAKALASQIENTLDGYRGMVYYDDDGTQVSMRIAGISLQNDLDALDQTDQPLLYRNSASYLITYEQ